MSSALSDDMTDMSEIVGTSEQQAHAAYAGMVPTGMKMSRSRGGANSLPTLPVELTVHHTFRYTRESGNLYIVTTGDIVKCLMASQTSTAARPVFRTIRIKKVTARGSCVIGDTATVSLRYLGSNTNEVGYMDQTMKVDVNASVSRRPPGMSLASFWIDVDSSELSTQLFQVAYYGSGKFYVDLAVEAIVDCTRYVNYSLNVGTGMSPGGIYAGALNAGLVPVGKTPT